MAVSAPADHANRDRRVEAPNRRTRRKSDRRLQLLSAAERLFAERGFLAVRLEDIGAAAGVSGPAIYRHFPNKESLLVELLVGISTRLLAEWVREKQAMTLEQAVRRLTFDSASTFGLYDRGLLRPGLVADIVIFDPDTVRPLPLEVVHDFPTGAKCIKEPAEGIMATVVNGEVLMENGKHTGVLPGRVLRNTYYHANH